MSAAPKKGTKTGSKKDAKVASRKGSKAAGKTGGKGGAAKTTAKTASKAVTKTGGAKATNKGNNTKANAKGNKGGAGAKGGNKGGKGGKKDTNKKNTGAAAVTSPVESKEEEKVSGVSSPLEVNIGPPVEIPDAKDFYTEIAPLKEFELKDDNIVDDIKQQFETFQALLKARKKACLTRARTLVSQENVDTAPICIDIEGMKKMINNIGIPQAEKEYNVTSQRTRCIDKAKELIAYETKLASMY